jgi:hypothetical protein
MPAMPRLPPLEPIKAALRALDSTTQPSSIPFPPLAPPSRSPHSSPASTSSPRPPAASLKTAQIFITIATEPYTKVVALEKTFPTHLTTPQSELRGERNRPRKLAASGGRRRPSAVGSRSDAPRGPPAPDVHAPCMRGPGRSWAGPTPFPPPFEFKFRFNLFL